MALKHIGFVAVGKDDQRKKVELLEYAGMTELDVKIKVLDGARAEGFKGTVDDRMRQLGWWIEPIYTQQVEGKCQTKPRLPSF